ncbi:MAG TPA: metallophosphoesterase [Candidatus Saccharimonadales bacterium]|nr:metallophosphoesterase [Candidatus Saccharimonadales bacterium]
MEAITNSSVEPIEAPQPTAELSGRQRLWRGVAKVALTGAVLTPFAALAAEDTVAWIAPDARISTPIAGGYITADAHLNDNLITINAQNFNLMRTSHASILGKDIGADVALHYNNVSLEDKEDGVNTRRLKALLQEFSDQKAQVTAIETAIKHHYEEWALGAMALTYMGGFGGLGWYRFRQRQLVRYSHEKRQHAMEDRRLPGQVMTAGVLVASLSLLYSGGYLLWAPNNQHHVTVDHNLDRTVLAGSGVSGPLKPVADSVIPWASHFFTAKNAYYDTLDKNFTTQFAQKYGATSLAPQSGYKRIILADDYQGEDGPARITGDVARAYNADLIVVGGDITATGSPLETPVLDALQSHAGKIPIELSLGHHDTAAVAAMAEARHMHVANGKVQTINGINIVGINSPDVIPFGGQASLRDPSAWPPGETIAQATQTLTENAISQACSLQSPTIFEMHDQLVGTPIAQASCPNVPVVLTGRQSPPHPPVRYQSTTEFISGSTGAHSNAPTLQALGIIHAPSIIEEITIDSDGRVVSSDIITLEGPSTNVTIQNNLASMETPAQAKISPVSVSR